MSLQGSGPAGISTFIAQTLLPSMTTIRVADVYEYEDLPKGGYPAATVTWTNKVAAVADNSRNRQEFTFTIRVFIDRNAKSFGVAKAETILKACGAELITKLEQDPTLGGTCISSNPAPFNIGYVDVGSNNIRLVEVQLLCIDVNRWR